MSNARIYYQQDCDLGKLNGKTVVELGCEVDEENDSVSIDGNRITLPSNFTYILFNKLQNS